ncbi:hypothetical protein D3C83_22720 [compost metagenome]
MEAGDKDARKQQRKQDRRIRPGGNVERIERRLRQPDIRSRDCRGGDDDAVEQHARTDNEVRDEHRAEKEGAVLSMK